MLEETCVVFIYSSIENQCKSHLVLSILSVWLLALEFIALMVSRYARSTGDSSRTWNIRYSRSALSMACLWLMEPGWLSNASPVDERMLSSCVT